MTELTITPKVADKTARFKGAVAAGEHVAVTIKGGAAWLGEDNGERLSLRVLDLVTGRTLALFPRPPETYEDGAESEEQDEWGTAGEDDADLFCNLNLNTDRMVNAARHMLRVPVLFVMGAKDEDNPATTRTLYFRDRYEVGFWPERVGDDTPYDLDRWPKQIDEWTELIAEFETRINAAEDSIRDAVDEANGIVAHVDAAKNAAQNSATAADSSASAAQGSAATAKNWATGGGETGNPGATNNAKYYAQQAGDAKTDAAASATSAAASATAAANSATAASGSATSAASSAQSAAGAAEAVVEMEKERAEGAESDLADAINAEKERAEGAEALAIVNAEYNSTSRRIVFTTGGGEIKTIDASAFIKDGMISSVSVSNGNLVITFNSDAGKQPISMSLTQIFNPANYYDKTAANGRFVQKETGKGLFSGSYNDLTDKPTIPAPVAIDSVLSLISENPVQNKAVKAAIDAKQDALHIGNVGWSYSAPLGEEGAAAFLADSASFTVTITGSSGAWTCNLSGYDTELYHVGQTSASSTDSPTAIYFIVTDASMTTQVCILLAQLGNGSAVGSAVDSAPTANSAHLVTSGGVYTALSGKADKSEMSVTPGTGADADKATIQLKSGTSATVLTAHQDIGGKANAADLPYAMVTPGEWEFSGSGYDPSKTYEVFETGPAEGYYSYSLYEDGVDIADLYDYSTEQALSLEFVFNNVQVTATRPSLPGHLLARAGNRVVVTGDTTLTLPAANPGYLRDFLVRLEISGSTVPTITFAAPTGETIAYETDGDEFPAPDEAGNWLYSFTESCVAHRFAVSLKKVNEVAQGGS